MICDFANWRPISVNFTPGGMAQIRGFVPHCQVGNGSLADFFNRSATQASTHFWISKTGVLEQYVDTDDKAWAEGAGNAYFISSEFEGQVDEPMTSQQLDMGGRLIAWTYQNVGQFPLAVNEHPDGQGITPHYAGGAAWGGHSCPGPLRFQQYPELILAALRYMDEGDDDMTDAQMDQLVDKVIARIQAMPAYTFAPVNQAANDIVGTLAPAIAAIGKASGANIDADAIVDELAKRLEG